jgi:hypothetical protein
MDSERSPPITMASPQQDRASSWVDNFVASYRYKYTWAFLIFPIFGLLPFFLVWRSSVALLVAIGAEVVFILAFVRWKTYRVQLYAGSVSAVSVFHCKTFALSDVDLIQHLHGDRGGQLLRIRHSDRILLTVSQDLDGFDDLVGFFREYARHHHLIFATRDDFGEWAQAGNPKTDDTSPGAE